MEAEAFTRSYKSLYRRIVYFAETLLNDREAAKDIVQDCFCKMYVREVGNEQSAKAFMFISVRNQCFNYLAHKKIEQDGADFIPAYEPVDPLSRMVRSELLNQLWVQINLLHPKKRDVTILTLGGASLDEISGTMRISKHTAKEHKRISLKKLREIFKNAR